MSPVTNCYNFHACLRNFKSKNIFCIVVDCNGHCLTEDAYIVILRDERYA